MADRNQYYYYAFISYKREDEEWAKWLQSEFEHYHLPTTLNGREDLPKEFRPIFRDVDELSAGNLPMQIYNALATSANLIVVCSPFSANSVWVNKEIQDFIAIGKERGIDNVEHIFPFIVDGEPHSKDPERECFPEALRELDGVQERIGGNINEAGRDRAFVKTIAGTMNVGFDSLWNRYEREKIQKERRIRRERNKLLIMQSRFLSEKIIDLAKDDSYLARLLALEILPAELNNPELRPYCVEAETALRTACLYSSGIIKGQKARFSPDGTKIVAISEEAISEVEGSLENSTDNNPSDTATNASKTLYTIKIFDSSNGVCLHTLHGHTDKIRSAIFSYDGKHIISLSQDKTVRVWDAQTGELEKIIPTSYEEPVQSLAITRNDKQIITTAWNHILKIWDMESGELIASHEIPSSNDVQLDTEDKKVILACSDFKYRIYDLDTWSLLYESLKVHPENLTSGAFSPDGKRIATATFNFDELVKIWDAETGECLHTLDGHKDTVYSAQFSPNGRKLVTASRDHTVRIWDIETGRQIGEPLVGHNDQVVLAMFSPDEKRVLSSSVDGTIRIWDLCPYRYNFIARARVIPDEITSIGDLYVKIEPYNRSRFSIWNKQTNRQVGKTIQGHTNVISSVSFSPDGKYVISGSYDKTAKVWDVQSGKQVGPTLEHFEEVATAVFAPKGNSVITETKNDYVMSWDWKPLQQLIDETHEKFKHRKLTSEEREKYYLIDNEEDEDKEREEIMNQ